MQQDSSSSTKNELLPKDMFSTATVSGAVSDFANKLKNLFAKQNFKGIGALIGTKINDALKSIDWKSIRTTVKSWAKNIADFLNGAISTINFKLVGSTIGNALMTAFEFAYKFVANFDFKKLGNAISQALNGLVNTIDFSMLASGLSNFAIGFLNTLTEALTSIDWNKFSKAVIRFISNIKWGSMGGAVTGLINSFATTLKSADFKSIGNAFRKGISSVNWKNIWKSLSNVVSGIIQSVADLFGLKGVNTSKLNSSLKKLYCAEMLGVFTFVKSSSRKGGDFVFIKLETDTTKAEVYDFYEAFNTNGKSSGTYGTVRFNIRPVGSVAKTLTLKLSNGKTYDMTDNTVVWEQNLGANHELEDLFHGNTGKRIHHKSYTPIEATLDGRLWVEPGDMIQIKYYVTDADGNYVYNDDGTPKTDIVTSYVLSRELTGIQALTDKITAKGD